jgi:hypothetical protein
VREPVLVALEAQHADHTLDELKEVYVTGRICDEDAFVRVVGLLEGR